MLELERLSPQAARELLERTRRSFRRLRDRVLDEAAGNPLALVELAREPPRDDSSRPPITLTGGSSARSPRGSTSCRGPRAACCSPPRSTAAPRWTSCHGRRDRQDVDRASALAARRLPRAVRFRHPLIRSAVHRRRRPAVLAMLRSAGRGRRRSRAQLWHRAMAAVGLRRGARRRSSKSTPGGAAARRCDGRGRRAGAGRGAHGRARQEGRAAGARRGAGLRARARRRRPPAARSRPSRSSSARSRRHAWPGCSR